MDNHPPQTKTPHQNRVLTCTILGHFGRNAEKRYHNTELDVGRNGVWRNGWVRSEAGPEREENSLAGADAGEI
jgi:hypothetical protein